MDNHLLRRMSVVGMAVATTINLSLPVMAVKENGTGQNATGRITGQDSAKKTNIVYIVLDDMGFSDFGCYGSEIKTPNIDKLATNGLRYNNFNVCPVCSPTRASLLTGRDNNAVGMGGLASNDLGPQNPNLRARITEKAATVAQLLKANGYSTMGVGKWHVAPVTDATPAGPFDYWPLAKGFERYYGHLGGETDQYSPITIYDNHAVDIPQKPGYQFSEDMTNMAKQFVIDQVSVTPDKPFFLYVAFGAVHSPHQAPQKYIDMYQGVYEKGWDKIRQERFERQKKMGIIPAGAELAPHDPKVQNWDSLTADEKRLFVRFQQAYAGYLTYADAQVGRLTDYLKAIGQFDKTMIVVISDNGATNAGGRNGADFDLKPFRGIRSSVKELLPAVNKIGGPDTQPLYPAGWAMVGNTPFPGYKFFLNAGGTRAPLIIHWPAGIKAKGEIRSQYVHVTDVTPTVLDVLNITAPATFQGIEQMPMHGTSMAYTFEGANAPTRHNVQYYLFSGDRSIFKDGWKAIANHRQGVINQTKRTPFENDQWELYNLNADYSEIHNVAGQYPEKLKELQALWQEEADKYGAVLKETDLMPSGNKNNVLKYYPGVGPIGSGAAPNIGNRSYTITAPINRTNKAQEGVLVSYGDALTGYVLFVKNNRLIYEHHCFGEVTKLISQEPVPVDACVVKYEFKKKGSFTGVGRLFFDNRPVGEVALSKTFGISSDVSFDVGCDRYVPVSADYKEKGEFPFNGKYEYVLVELQND